MSPVSPTLGSDQSSACSLSVQEEALAALASEARLEQGQASCLLFDSLDEAAILLQGGCIAYANPAAVRLLNTTASSLIGKRIEACLEEQAFSALFSHLRAGNEASLKLHGELHCANGDAIPVDIQCFPVRGAPDQHMLFMREGGKLVADLSDPSMLRLEQLPCGVIRLDPQLRYLYGNRASTRVAAFFSSAGSGKTVMDLGWPASLCDSLGAAVAQLVHEPVPRRVPLTVTSLEAKEEWWAEALPVCDRNGHLQSVLFLLDTQNAELAQNDLAADLQRQHERKRFDQAVAAAQARDAFFSWVSHELRTPMNGIQSWAHILETYVNASSASPLAQRALRGIRHGISQQLQLVDELLDVSRIIEGKLNLAKQPFNLRPSIQAAMESIQDTSRAKHVHLACHYTLARERVCGDPCRVEQILRLLLAYLVDHSPNDSTLLLAVHRGSSHIALRLSSSCGNMQASNNASPPSAARRSKPAILCRKELDVFLARRLAELQGGLLECEKGKEAGLPAFTLSLPLHMPSRRRTSAE